MSSVRWVSIIFVLGWSCTAAQYPLSAEGRVRDYLLNRANYSARNRPALNSNETVDISLEISFYAMLDLNEKDEVITMASWSVLNWTDARLRWDPADYDGVDLVIMYVDEIWTPKIIVSNSVSADLLSLISPDRGSVLLTSEGLILLGAPLILSTHCPISVRYFPFDSQLCHFTFTPENQFREQINLLLRKPVYLPDIDTNEWGLVEVTVRNYDYQVVGYLPTRPVLDVSIGNLCIHISRDPRYHVNTLIFPSALLCLLAFVTFLAPTDSGERLSLGVSMVLGMTVFQLLVIDTLPAGSENGPIIGMYLQVNFILTCLAVPLSVGNINIACGDNKLPMMKWAWFRRLVLETLPRWFLLPTYRERVRRGSVVPRLMSMVSVTDDEVRETAATPPRGGNPLAPARKQVEPIRTTGHPVIGHDELTPIEKAKLEARTVALVFDRLEFACFLVVFVIVAASFAVAYVLNPGPTNVECTDQIFA